ncbi:D-alpha,beta-D-heptose 7-phosphate 1-kinase [Desulfuromusa kysingii]|uniref:Bifunctional protein HldE n=1 Tax=Desulfuromusa kysingii TaxID=37625 RepID=A0A1H4CXC6_9BACT|nr:bifunctional D-glycero-beta-D-manno-heptose-7-phosphate kinase/D-glycero-beta-D-manno-heptose 1-phosphate adenylyltransferase HldE [Desulfuromusa kysingii]SEA65105.1 D-alpha,beta-D-heptose 7-phosphate 1-kinase [Desulfuromusa kysingii]
MNLLDVEQLVHNLSDLKFLVIGDLLLDKYLFGDSQRISPEAPIPVVDILREEVRLGGAGNVANNLAVLGCGVEVVSVVGTDPEGMQLKGLLQRQGIRGDGVLCVSARVTPCKTRILASNQQMLRLDREECFAIAPSQETQLLDFVRQVVPNVDVVVISDYQKGVLTDHLLGRLIECCASADCPVIADPKGDDFSRYQGVSLLTPNHKEVELASATKINSPEVLISVGQSLQQKLNLGALLVTRGKDGMSLFVSDQPPDHLPTEARDIYDVTGAGDTVLAFCAVGLANGFSVLKSAMLANIAAGIVVGKVGTSTVSAAEVLMAAIDRDQSGSGKVLFPEQLDIVIAGHRQAGKTIVFTNGCFDLLHAGHIKYLQRARELGDLLVLGLNSDASIRRLKGETRPLLCQTERAQILAALDCVDYVTVFAEDTPLELIRLVKPDVLAKGGDYSPEQVVGREYVESYGGTLVLVEFQKGKSTTNIIEEVLTRYRD